MAMYEVSITIQVDDPQELWRRAMGHYEEENGTCDSDVLEDMLGTEEEPDIAGCLIQLYDPGKSFPGTSILGSVATASS